MVHHDRDHPEEAVGVGRVKVEARGVGDREGVGLPRQAGGGEQGHELGVRVGGAALENLFLTKKKLPTKFVKLANVR